ncbi:guanylate kinase [Caulobacter sp. Root1455]|uniref:guanylate kinase n=1 Tax=unclassified Caulobacter TaxID=2648921 RepID=UPI0006F4D1A1|nr:MULTISPECIES: guanylate kinase [unclassified Caulobacter]KQY29750.1 guanylate kinase [Caulobacter sp. Root487D2Y]KQZ05960.1 guanylate kinase [Caulobacter sp. Root1455]
MSNNPHGRTRGLLLMVVAPSGVGKTSLTRRLVADHNDLHLSISATTREPRPGEHDGRDYHFVSHDKFQVMIQDDAFLEWAEVYGNHYGSPRGPIMEALDRGESVLFDIDFQGAMKVHKQAGQDSVLVYILPPSLAEMSRRLHARSQDSEEVIHRRLARAKDEVAAWEQFDYVILNDDFDKAYSDLAHIYHAERQKRSRNPWIGNLVADLLKEEI